MRRIRKLGFVVLAALALGALGAAPASAASDFIRPTGSSLHLEGVGQKTHTLGFGGNQFANCVGQTFTGELPESRTLVATIKDTSCSMPTYGYKGVPFKSNGCKLNFLPGDALGWGPYAGTFNIGPPGCGPMTIPNAACTITIPAQTGLQARYETVNSGGKERVGISPEANGGMKYTREGPACTDGTFTDGSWIAGVGWLVTASKEPGSKELLDFKLQEAPDVTRIHMESFPATILGEQNPKDLFAFRIEKSGPRFECESAGFSGVGGLQTFYLPANPKECTAYTSFGNFPMSVTMNSCQYVLNATSISAASVGIDCSNPEDSMEFHFLGEKYCKVTVGPQAAVAGVTLANTKSGTVVTDWNLKSIKYTVTKHQFWCTLKNATHEDGEYFGEVTLEGKTGSEISQFIEMRE